MSPTRIAFGLIVAGCALTAKPAAGQSPGTLVDFGVGLSMAAGNHDAYKSGVRFEAGTDAVSLGGGFRLGVRVSAGLHTGGLENYCGIRDGPRESPTGGSESFGRCRTNFPSFILVAPEVRWHMSRDVRLSLGSGPWWGTDQDVRVAAQAGLDLAGAISPRSAVLLSARVLTAPRRGDRSITSFGIVLGLQRRFGR